MRKGLAILAVLAALACLVGSAEGATSVTRSTITWTLKHDYTTGQYANGDYYVVADTVEGSDPNVVITGISPATVVVDGDTLHGSMINPMSFDWVNWAFLGGSRSLQGLDSRNAGYAAGTNIAIGVSAETPLVITPSKSLVSVHSLTDAEVTAMYPRRTYIDYAAVLTIVSAAPAANSFRPAYAGTVSKISTYTTADIQWALLPSPGLTPTDGGYLQTLTAVADDFNGLWLDYWPGSGGRWWHPNSIMQDYGAYVAAEINIGGLMLLCDYTQEQKTTLMIRYLQLGLDYYGIVHDANGICVWAGDGGHGPGRKWPIIFAGIMFANSNMRTIDGKSGDYFSHLGYAAGYNNANYAHDHIQFAEDGQTFYVNAGDVYSTPYAMDGYLNESTQYEVGTAQVTQGDHHVVGNGTLWVTGSKHPSANSMFGVNHDDQAYSASGRAYTILSIEDETHLTLTANYTGDTNALAVYLADSAPIVGYGHYDPSTATDFNEMTTAMIGQPNFGHRHFYVPDRDPTLLDWAAGTYKTGQPFCGSQLCALIMGAKTYWNHNAFFDYTDYYMTQTKILYGTHNLYRQDGNYGGYWLEDMWDTYRANYGYVWPATGPTAKYLIGRKTS